MELLMKMTAVVHRRIDMKVGIIGYGSMGSMIYQRLYDARLTEGLDLYVANRTFSKIKKLKGECTVCSTNTELASECGLVFICVRPADIPDVLAEIAPVLQDDALTVSLNVNISFETLEAIADRKYAKVLPGVTAEIGRSQTLVCFNDKVPEDDRIMLKHLMKRLGDVYELRENEMGMGSELVSCMPGFMGAIFDVICKAAEDNLSFTAEEILRMVRNTFAATGALVTEKDMSFREIVERVATPGGITQEGTAVIYEKFPEIADDMFRVTLEKRKKIAEKAAKKIK